MTAPRHMALGVEERHGALDQVDGSPVGEDQLQFITNDRLARGSGDLGWHLLWLQLDAIAEDLVGDSRLSGARRSCGDSCRLSGACRI